jgi:hypothetical protein
MCSKSVGIVSKKTILKNHPFVENAEAEEKQLEKEQKEAEDAADIYGGSIGGANKDNPKGGGVNV